MASDAFWHSVGDQYSLWRTTMPGSYRADIRHRLVLVHTDCDMIPLTLVLAALATSVLTSCRKLQQDSGVEACCAPYSSDVGIIVADLDAQSCVEFAAQLGPSVQVLTSTDSENPVCLAPVDTSCSQVQQLSGYTECDDATTQAADQAYETAAAGGPSVSPLENSHV